MADTKPKRPPRHKPLLTRLRSARMLLREWRRALVKSECYDFEATPPIFSRKALHELARFYAADAALSEVIRDLEATDGKRQAMAVRPKVKP